MQRNGSAGGCCSLGFGRRWRRPGKTGRWDSALEARARALTATATETVLRGRNGACFAHLNEGSEAPRSLLRAREAHVLLHGALEERHDIARRAGRGRPLLTLLLPRPCAVGRAPVLLGRSGLRAERRGGVCG